MNLYQDIFFGGLDLLRGRRNVRRLRFLRESQHWTPGQLSRWQLERLNALLEQARRGSAFHRRRLAGVELPLPSLDELAGLPILTKQDIRENREAIRADNLPIWRTVPTRTGGSTGRPMTFYWDKRGMDWNRGAVYRSMEWAGASLGDRTIQMSGSQYDEAEARRFRNRLAAFLHRNRHCSVAWVSDEVHERYFRVINSYRPTSIWGYSSGIDLLARYIAARHPAARFPFLRALITSSEVLRPEQRERINAVFGAGKVFDNYGSREMYVGAECSEHDGYHVHGEVVHLEVVDRDGNPCAPGVPGRVLLTDLTNHAFPFIRYEIGDVASLAEPRPCPCGVTLPRLDRLEGRIGELVVLRDRTLTSANFAAIFDGVDGVAAYQIVQEKPDAIDILLEPDAGFTAATRARIEGVAETLVAGQARVRVRTDRPIEVPESGKRRFVVSAVDAGA